MQQQLLHSTPSTKTNVHTHSGSGNKISGVALGVGNRIRPTDRYADFCGGWLPARPEDIGKVIEQGCAIAWVRPL